MILSIITINYNDSIGLKKTMVSVHNQTWKEFEYVIVDGNSKDNSVEVIKSFEFDNLIWVSEPDSGIYNAMNKGIKMASGSYLLFLNSGDCLYSNITLENCIPHLDLSYSFISGHLHYLDKQNKSQIKKHPKDLSFSNLVGKSVAHPSTFIKNEMFKKYGLYNESYKIVSDWEFFLKALGLNGESFKSIDVVVSDFDNLGISSNSDNLKIIEAERESVLKRYLATIYNDEFELFLLKSMYEPSKRIKYLFNIETSSFLRKLTTVLLMFISSLVKR